MMTKSEYFIHPGNGSQYEIKSYLCLSNWIIYTLVCPCGLIYVGETTCDLRYTIRKKRLDQPVSKHCVEKGHNEWDLKCMIVDSVPPLSRRGDRLTKLMRKELEWIYKLNSRKPQGLNVEFKTSAKMIR